MAPSKRFTGDRDRAARESGGKAKESAKGAPLGTRIAARFARVGLSRDIPELRGQPPRPADFE